MRTLEGRKVREHEDLLIEILGHDWEQHVDNHRTIDTWMKHMRPHIARFLDTHGLPQDPKFGKTRKVAERKDKGERKKKEGGG